MSQNAAKAATVKDGKKATTAPANMDAATIATTAAAVLKKYHTIAGIKATAAKLREKYGAENWKAILSRCKEFRGADIETAAKAVRESVFTYRAVLAAQFKALAGDKNFRHLCGLAKAAYKGTDTDAAAHLVRDYFPTVDAATGAPLVMVRYCDEKTGFIYTAYAAKELTDAAALAVLRGCLSSLERALKVAARHGKDAAPVIVDNKRQPGKIVAVYECGSDARGLFVVGAKLTGDHASTDASTARKAAAAALIGKAVPSTCARVAELNAAARAAYIADAERALKAERDALKADATAAGLKAESKPASKGKKAERARKAAAASMAAVDAFIAATVATTDAPALNA